MTKKPVLVMSEVGNTSSYSYTVLFSASQWRAVPSSPEPSMCIALYLLLMSDLYNNPVYC